MLKETIIVDGHVYKLVKPAFPDWVKDGAVLVNISTGKKSWIAEGETGFYRVFGLHDAGYDLNHENINGIRPIKPEDWKWGDWAMYGRKKVFVIRWEGEWEHEFLRISHPSFGGGFMTTRCTNLTPA